MPFLMSRTCLSMRWMLEAITTRVEAKNYPAIERTWRSAGMCSPRSEPRLPMPFTDSFVERGALNQERCSADFQRNACRYLAVIFTGTLVVLAQASTGAPAFTVGRLGSLLPEGQFEQLAPPDRIAGHARRWSRDSDRGKRVQEARRNSRSGELSDQPWLRHWT